jgi:hypothetical protein
VPTPLLASLAPCRKPDLFGYTINLSFEDLQELFDGLSFNTVDILTSDFVVALRNKDGIFGLVYLIDNRCEVQAIE